MVTVIVSSDATVLPMRLRLSSFPSRLRWHPQREPDWLGLTEGRPATPLSILSPQRPATTFFRRLRLCIANQKSRLRPPSTSFQPFGCGSIASGLTTAIEVAIGAAR